MNQGKATIQFKPHRKPSDLICSLFDLWYYNKHNYDNNKQLIGKIRIKYTEKPNSIARSKEI